MMDLKRFFTDEKVDGSKIILRGAEFIHATKVTRHKVGYKIIICDNTNKDYYSTIQEINKDFLIAHVDNVEINTTENALEVKLFIGNNKDIDTVVQKAVELGVTEIIPFSSQHCNVKNLNLDRLNKIIIESSKQCGRSKLATIKDLVSLQEAIEIARDSQIVLFYEHETEKKVKDLTFNKELPISIFIGCEGGFSIEEVESFVKLGVVPCSLGKRILRVSTAVVSAITLINDKIDE